MNYRMEVAGSNHPFQTWIGVGANPERYRLIAVIPIHDEATLRNVASTWNLSGLVYPDIINGWVTVYSDLYHPDGFMWTYLPGSFHETVVVLSSGAAVGRSREVLLGGRQTARG